MFTRAFWKAAAERAAKSAAQSALLVLGAEQVDVLAVSWAELAGLTAGGALLSLLTSLASAGVGNAGPSLSAEVLTPPAPAIDADAPRHLKP